MAKINVDVLLDVLRHTSGLGNLEVLKVTGSEDETKIESMAADNSVVFKAFLKEPIKEFNGEFGMSNLSVLKGFAEFPQFKTDGASVTVVRAEKGGKECPIEIIFEDDAGRDAHYRLLNSELVPLQPKPIASAWDIDFTPDKSKIQELAKMASILSGEEFFNVKNVKGDLRFYIGDETSSGHRTYVSFNNPTEGTLDGLHWMIPTVLDCLKLINGDTLSTRMSILSKGLLQIKLETKYCEYLFLLPAKKK